MADGPSSADLAEVEGECRKLLDYAEQAVMHYRDGKPASAALVLGLMHYPLSHATTAVSGALDVLKANEGVTPDDALE
jgi:hypothetical protein